MSKTQKSRCDIKKGFGIITHTPKELFASYEHNKDNIKTYITKYGVILGLYKSINLNHIGGVVNRLTR